LLDLLVRTGVIYPLTSPSVSADAPELAKARTQYTDLVEQIGKKERKLEEERAALSKDWGRDWEWKKLEGTCVEQDSGESVPDFAFWSDLHDSSLTGSWPAGTLTLFASLAKRVKSQTTMERERVLGEFSLFSE